jgi:hypothetical protein
VELEESDFASHPDVKLFAAHAHIVHETMPRHPEHPAFRLGKTLGYRYTDFSFLLRILLFPCFLDLVEHKQSVIPTFSREG